MSIKPFRRPLVITIVLLSTLTIFIVQKPSNNTKASIILTNMRCTPVLYTSFSRASYKKAVVISIPADKDYELVSFIAVLSSDIYNPNSSLEVNLYADGGTAPGAFLVSLGNRVLPTRWRSIRYSPTTPFTLERGTRYWIILENATGIVNWHGCNPSSPPAGELFAEGEYTYRAGSWVRDGIFFLLSIDANPILEVPSPPSTGANIVPACSNSDGRLNSICVEPYQTAAIYCRSDGSIDVYGITDGAGWLAFRTTQAEVDAVGIPNLNTLLERSLDGKIRLYRLSTGEFQVNAPMWDEIRGNLPDGYVFKFEGCG